VTRSSSSADQSDTLYWTYASARGGPAAPGAAVGEEARPACGTYTWRAVARALHREKTNVRASGSAVGTCGKLRVVRRWRRRPIDDGRGISDGTRRSSRPRPGPQQPGPGRDGAISPAAAGRQPCSISA
jgi:hypothetical protein